MGRYTDGPIRVDSAYGHRQVNIMRLAAVAVQPGTVQPPRIVRIVAKGKAIIRQLGHARHVTAHFQTEEIGRALCRERVCQYVSISVVVGSLNKNNNTYQ